MIRLVKVASPAVLTLNAAVWTGAYVRRISGDMSVPVAALGRYRHRDIKAQLRVETSDKCAYCESYVPHVSHGDVEHILPKSRFPELVLAWSNLTLSCSVCNTAKGEYWDPELSVLNPYVDDPFVEFAFLGPMIVTRFGGRGYVTVQQLRLNRAELILRRSETLLKVDVLVALYLSQEERSIRAVLGEQIRFAADDTQEHAAAVRSFLVRRGFQI